MIRLSKHNHHKYLTTVVLLGVILSTLGLPQHAAATNYYVLDRFGTAAYTNQNGSANWSTDWIETNDDGIATTGTVLITGGELRLNNSVGTGAFESIERGLNLASVASATLSFNARTAATEAGDVLVLEVYDADTASWTTLQTFTGAVATAYFYYDITSYQSADTRIRFRITGGYTAADEFFYVDNAEINCFSASTHSSTSVRPTVQTYYIPVPEDQGLLVLDTINAAANSPMTAWISLTINADDTVIYFDHWEDGFEAEVNDPQQNTSEVWGDNNSANGMPPGYFTDILNAGDVVVLNNWIPTGSLGLIDFDGGDKIASTDAIAVTRSAWASGSGTLHGGSVEMLDTSVWGTRYDVPADATTQANDFDYAGIAVMAAENNTQIFLNAALVTTLDEGESYLFNDNVSVGDQITSSASIQANFLTGNIGSNYESSWFTLYPYDLLSSSYYAPVDGTGTIVTAVYIQNPGASSITVNWTTTAGAQTPVVVAAGAAARILMPNTGTGARFYTNGAVFQAISVIDSNAQASDWGYTLIPENQLTQQAMVGWGVGQDPTITPQTENGSPVWVVALGSGTMNICVDYDGDGIGGSTDSNGRQYDQLLTVTNLQRSKVYDTDGDQTGMLLYLCNGSEAGNVNKIAVAWGQDPATATPGAPGLDVGTSVPPLPNFTSVKGAELVIDLNNDTLFDVGETFEYQIRISNTGALPIPTNSITVSDIIPQYTLYVPNSTSIYYSATGLTTSITDNGVPPNSTAFPLDEGGYLIPQQLWIEEYFIVTFDVIIDATLPGTTRIENYANINGLNLIYDPTVEIIVQPPDLNSRIGDFIWLDLDGDGVQDAGEPGIPGVTLELQDGSCIPNSTCLTDATDSAGEYGFPNLINNTYTVVVRTATLPGGLTQTGDPDSTVDNQHTVALNSGNKPYLTADFGYQGNVSIGDFVWNDLDADGVQDGGAETGLTGVTIDLTWAGPDGNLATTSDNLTFATTTNGAGAYSFTSLPAGTYRVDLDQATLPANYVMTTTDPLVLNNLSAGTSYTTADFGATAGATIGDYVWNDMDNDGIQDGTESGLSDLRVYIDANGNGSYDSGELNDVTDANGNYIIPGLAAGTYSVRVDASTVPAGFTATTTQPLSVTVSLGQYYVTADFGYRVNALSISKVSSAGGSVTPGDSVTYTITVQNNSGATQTGIVVSDPLPAGTTYVAQSTLVNGYYIPAIIEDTFPTVGNGTTGTGWTGSWIEIGESDGYAAGDIQVIAAGLRIQDNDNGGEGAYREVDLSGYTSPRLSLTYTNIGLNNADEDVTLDISTNGGSSWTTLYTWDGILADGSGSLNIDISSYIDTDTRIRFLGSANLGGTSGVTVDNLRITGGIPPTALTRDNVPGGTDPDLASGVPSTLVLAGDNFALSPGQSMQVTFQVTVDNPVVGGLTSIDNTAQVTSTQQTTPQQASASDDLVGLISNYIWNDANGDGSQTGESGLDGVRVYIDQDGDNAYDVGEPSSVTAGGGLYSIGDLAAGTYAVRIDTSTLPAGYAQTYDLDGISTAHEASVTLTTGQMRTDADFGYQQQNAVISDFVWHDIDGDGVQDGGLEAGLSGVRVYIDQDGDNTYDVGESTALTDVSGIYSISGLVAGTYDVRIDTTTLPAGYAPTYDLDGGMDNEASVTVTAGQTHSDVDFGYQLPKNFGHLPSTLPGVPSAYAGMNLLADGGAWHLTGTTYLGATVTTAADGINTPAYTPKASDDGVTWTPSVTWTTGGTGSVDVTATCPSNPCYLDAWFDWNRDGDFNDTGEQIFTDQTINNGLNTLSINIPGTAVLDGSTFYSRFRIYPVQPTSPQPNGRALAGSTLLVGEIEDPFFQINNGSVPTPVTVSYFVAQRQTWGGGNTITFTWSTATETGNVGFNLYVESGRKLTQINKTLIPSKVIDSLDRQDYTFSATVKGNTFYIEDVSVLGETRLHGPFKIGGKYGDRLAADKIDQSAVDAEHDRKHDDQQDELRAEITIPEVVIEAAVERLAAPTAAATLPAPAKCRETRRHPCPVTPSPTATATETVTPTSRATESVELTATQPVATDTPTFEPVATETATIDPSTTDTSAGEPAGTEPPTLEPTATESPTVQPTETESPTLEPTATETLTLEPTAAPTLEPTATATPLATLVPLTNQAVDPASLMLTTTLNFKVRQTGLYHVTYETLRDAGLDLAGVPLNQITLINRDQTVPIYVHMADQTQIFGLGGFIEFYGEALDTIYTDTNIYTIQVSNVPVRHIPDDNTAPDLGLVPPVSYTETMVMNNQRAYANYAPGNETWYDTSMLAFTSSKTWNFPFAVNGLADPSASATFDLVVWGVTNWPQNPDHHLLVYVNGVQLANEIFDGLIEHSLKISLPAGSLQEGSNTLQLTIPGDLGTKYDMVNLDKFSLTYPRLFQAQNGRLTFKAAGYTLNVANLPSANVMVYRMSADGGLAHLQDVNVQAVGNSFTATFAGSSDVSTYLVTTTEALSAPTLEAARQQVDLNHPAQYLIISHPDFISGLQPLVHARQAQGFSVSVVDVTDLYTQYTNGIFDPRAIQNYIVYAAQNLGTQYVLLVGGDTYDYRNFTGRDSISFIPSLYVNTGLVAKFVPADPLYADLNKDNVPDLAIGRFPVRTTAELTLIVDKTLAYAGKNYGQTAVFASDKNDGIVSFKDISTRMSYGLPSNWSVQSIDMDDLTVATAQSQLITAMNNGTALVNFTGHSGPTSWTFSNLFNTKNAAALTNAGKPFVVVQWGCWNTYFVDPVNNYLVQSLLFSGNNGAAAVLGASTLTESSSEQLLGQLLTPRMVTPGMTVGQALRDAKLELSQTHPELLDVLLGWSLMGDPALMIEP